MLRKSRRARVLAAMPRMVLALLLLYGCVTVLSTLSGGAFFNTRAASNTRVLFLAGGKWVKKDAPLTPPPGPMYPWWDEAPSREKWVSSWNARWSDWDTWKKQSDHRTDWWVAWWGISTYGYGAWQWSFERPEWRKRWYNGYRQQWRTTLPYVEKDGTVWNRTVHSFRAPSMVEVDGVLVAIADARYRSSTDYHLTDIVAKYSADGGKTWKTEVIIRNPQVNPVYSRVVDPTVVVKGNKIFVLAGMFYNTYGYWSWHANSSDWDAAMYVGDVEKTVADGVPAATITWKKLRTFKEEYLSRYQYNVKPDYEWDTDISWEPSHFLGGVGHGIVTSTDLYKEMADGQREKVADKGVIIIPIQIKQGTFKVAATILYSKDDGKTWKFGDGRTPIHTTESSVVEWKGMLLLNARSDSGFRKVFTSDDMGNNWEEYWKLSKVWGNAPSRRAPGSSSSTIKVNIEGRDLMLLTVPKNTRESHDRDRLQLWITDGDRVFLVGQVSNGDDKGPYATLMHMKDPKTREDVLYCLHEQNIDEIYSIVSVKLVVHMERIRWVVRMWNRQDKLLAGGCRPAFLTPPGGRYDMGTTGCKGVPTMGLLGLLAGGHASVFSNASKWRDAFGCVDANVVGGTVVRGNEALQFTENSSHGVFWPVSTQGQDRRYEAVNTEHTIAATVLRSTLTGSTLVMAEKMRLLMDGNSSNVMLQVLHDSSGAFALRCVGERSASDTSRAPCDSDIVSRTQPRESTGSLHQQHERGVGSRWLSMFHTGATYQLTLVMQNVRKPLLVENKSKTWVTLYVNGEKASVLEMNTGNMSYVPDIEHFYVGGAGVTVKNVLLYNRQLGEAEVRQLSDNIDNIKLSDTVATGFVSGAFSPINITYTDEWL
ncbi:putative trans-sialidase [Trypanosoma vivax]|nr:putative trans-sialidase [Trypanosoma vivax]